jgi:translation initiation factor IF-1
MSTALTGPATRAHHRTSLDPRRVQAIVRWDEKMSKEELIQFEGLVIEILPDARYRVQLDAGYEVLAYTAGKMKKNRIKTLVGDRVTVEMSPYDLQKGRLIFRHKDESETGRRPPLWRR